MDADATLAEDSPTSAATTFRLGPYVIAGRLAVYAGVEVLTATHEVTGTRVVLRRLLALPSLSFKDRDRRLDAFQQDTRARQSLQDPRHLVLFDFARNPDGSAYQAFALSDGLRGAPRDAHSLPLEEWTRISAEIGAALESLLEAGVEPLRFDPAGLLLGLNGQVRLCPLDFPWPPSGVTSADTATRSLAEWLYQILAATPLPPGSTPASLCDLNPRVSPELDMIVRAAMNPYAVNAVSTPGEFARLLRDRESPRVNVAGDSAHPPPAGDLWAQIGAWAVVLAIGGVTLGWLLSLFLAQR